MKELTVLELEMVSGAGWLQDGLKSMGGKFGEALWSADKGLLNIELPLIGAVNLASLAPSMGKTIGENLGNALGGAIESGLSKLPNVGGFFTKLFA